MPETTSRQASKTRIPDCVEFESEGGAYPQPSPSQLLHRTPRPRPAPQHLPSGGARGCVPTFHKGATQFRLGCMPQPRRTQASRGLQHPALATGRRRRTPTPGPTGVHAAQAEPVGSQDTCVPYRLVVWKQECKPTRKGLLDACSNTCFSVCTQSIS